MIEKKALLLGGTGFLGTGWHAASEGTVGKSAQ